MRYRLSSVLGILVAVMMFSGLKGHAMQTEKATFGAGCFWGVEKIFMKLDGVLSTEVGYAGGQIKNPSYEQVCAGITGHAEVLQLTFDPSKVSYDTLLETFWKYHDPTTLNQQGPDVGSQYRSIILYHNENQKNVAEKQKRVLDASGIFKKPIVTEIVPATEFYRAEDYHQKYLQKNPHGYCSHFLRVPDIHKVLQS